MNNNTPNGGRPQADLLPLPQAAMLPDGLSKGACPWLDEYVSFSQKWSPRGDPRYHVASGVWALSTVAARRVGFHFGKLRYTNMYIALVSRTGLFAKSSTAQIAKEVISTAGLGYLLLPDATTPQKMIADMAGRIPDDFFSLDPDRQNLIKLSLATAGQRGWYYDEFGMLIAGMMRPDGVMSDFRGTLRRFDDGEPRYENATLTRGHEVVENPYLTLLANVPPANLQPYAGKGSALWGDGFLARFAVVTPTDKVSSTARFPKGVRIIPDNLITPLHNWDKRLGYRIATIVKNGDKLSFQVQPLTTTILDLAPEVYDAVYRYSDALIHNLNYSDKPDLDGNYVRFPEKALRMAALFTSLSGARRIELPQYALAQEITEEWRISLHVLYDQLTSPDVSRNFTNQQKVMRVILQRGNPTKREIEQYSHLTATPVQDAIDELLDIKEIISFQSGGTTRFTLNPNPAPPNTTNMP